MDKLAFTDQSFLALEQGCAFGNSEHTVDFVAKSPRGHVRMYCVEGGEQRLFHEDPNVVVHTSRKILANLLAYGRLVGGDPLEDYVVSKAKFGNRGVANDVFVVNPDPALVTDEDLQETTPAAIFTADGDDFTVEDIAQQGETYAWAVTFKAVMDVGEGYSGFGGTYQNYTEMGLFSGNDTLFARKTFPSFVKTATRKLVVFWSIIF